MNNLSDLQNARNTGDFGAIQQIRDTNPYLREQYDAWGNFTPKAPSYPINYWPTSPPAPTSTHTHFTPVSRAYPTSAHANLTTFSRPRASAYSDTENVWPVLVTWLLGLFCLSLLIPEGRAMYLNLIESVHVHPMIKNVALVLLGLLLIGVALLVVGTILYLAFKIVVAVGNMCFAVWSFLLSLTLSDLRIGAIVSISMYAIFNWQHITHPTTQIEWFYHYLIMAPTSMGQHLYDWASLTFGATYLAMMVVMCYVLILAAFAEGVCVLSRLNRRDCFIILFGTPATIELASWGWSRYMSPA